MTTARLIFTGLVLMVIASVAGFPQNPPDKNGNSEPEDKQTVTSKATTQQAATKINFRKDLKLPFDSLSTLGSRIDAARRKPDPVALAHAASELSIAEKVSGQQTSLTSQMLAKEAGELAALRRQNQELQAVLQVKQQLAMAESEVQGTKKDLAIAEAQLKVDQEAKNVRQEPTWKPRTIIVNNFTTQYLDIYVNGYYKTQVKPGMQQTIIVEHRWNPTVLKAYGDEDTNNWGPLYIRGRFDQYTWNIEG